MLELNSWFFVLVLNFLVLLFVLDRILFKPMLKVFKERREATEGALEAAREMEAQKDEALDIMKSELAGAAARARETFDALRAEGMEAQREAVEAAQQEAARAVQAARETLGAEAARAKKSLGADAERFARDIAKKLIKV